MQDIELNIFRLEPFRASKESHKMLIEELSKDNNSKKYLGNLYYMLERIYQRRDKNYVDQFYVAYLKDKIVGFISLSIINDKPYISSGILKEYRGESLGKLLLQEFTYYLQDTYNYDKIYLSINENNKVAISSANFVGYSQDDNGDYYIKR